MVAQGIDQPVVVHLDQARYTLRIGGSELTLKLDFRVHASELVCVQVDRGQMMGLIGDACCGMLLPSAGSATYGGRAWDAQEPQTVSAMRATIGRGGHDAAWLPFLSVADNVLLAPMHHTRRPTEQLVEQAASLAHELGLPGLPIDMPGDMGLSDLNRSSIVRAFMGRPKLVLLEEADVREPELTPMLANRILAAQNQGTAVVWVSDTIPDLGRGELGKTSCYRLRSSGVLEKLA